MDYRLKKEKDFNAVFKQGKRIFSKNLTLIYLEKEELKAGFAVGKKHGGSVQRNKIKRYLRESFRSFIPVLRKNFFFVFIPKIQEEYSVKEFVESMNYIFKKGNFLL
ncbi:MAG: ribonuclease P protein component [Clostridia bacterium]|nr:ribonuclease P protein component [Clostridia bacterium]